MELLLLVVGLVLLVGGAELLVRGSARLALSFGISPLVVGLTLVSFGTSAPELAVSVRSAWGGTSQIAVGNVIGSNIVNILLILGLSALAAPLMVSRQLIRQEVPLMIALSGVVWLMCADGMIGRSEGGILFAGIIAYIGWSIRLGRRDASAAPDELASDVPAPGGGALANLAIAALGLGLLVLGSHWMVDGASGIARRLGMSELIIGLTVVALGTSLPELATSVVASLRGQRDIAVGNAIGSNIFNILAVLGAAGLVAPLGLPVSMQALQFDLPVMVAVAAACLPIFLSRGRISRWEGALFVAYYAAYLTYLVLAAIDWPLLPAFQVTMLFFVLPLTGIGIIASVIYSGLTRKRHLN